MFEKVAWARSEEERLRIQKEKEEPIIQKLIEAIKDKLANDKILSNLRVIFFMLLSSRSSLVKAVFKSGKFVSLF